jgi:hypothetical protein
MMLTKWEYYILTLDFSPEYSSQVLDDLGLQGWELVAVGESLKTYVFKRPINVSCDNRG